MWTLLCFIALLNSVLGAPGYLDYGGLSAAPAISAIAAVPTIAAAVPAVAAGPIVSKTEYHISHPPSAPRVAAIKTIQPAIHIQQPIIQKTIIPAVAPAIAYGHSDLSGLGISGFGHSALGLGLGHSALGLGLGHSALGLGSTIHI